MWWPHWQASTAPVVVGATFRSCTVHHASCTEVFGMPNVCPRSALCMRPCMSSSGVQGSQTVDVERGRIAGSCDLRDGHWHHICVVLEPGNGHTTPAHHRLYVDGEEDSTSIRTAVGEVSTGPDADLKLGADLSGNSGFVGLLQDLRVYARTLSAEEVCACAPGAPSADRPSCSASFSVASLCDPSNDVTIPPPPRGPVSHCRSGGWQPHRPLPQVLHTLDLRVWGSHCGKCSLVPGIQQQH